MRVNHNTNASPSTIIASLSLMDNDGQEAISRLILRVGRKIPWIGEAIHEALKEQISHEENYSAWLEYESEKHENRYALEK